MSQVQGATTVRRRLIRRILLRSHLWRQWAFIACTWSSDVATDEVAIARRHLIDACLVCQAKAATSPTSASSA